MKMMRAARLTGYGGPDKLELANVPKPVPKPGEVLIKVAACSVNNTDINTRTGWYGATGNFQELLRDEVNVGDGKAWGCSESHQIHFPRIQGTDVVGVVMEVGDGGNQELIGKRVLMDPVLRDPESAADVGFVGSEIDGGFAQFAVVPERNVYTADFPLTDAELAAIPCAYSTAENMLTKGKVDGKDVVVIFGASGGVGTALIQLVKARTGTAIAVVGKGKCQQALDLGADFALERDGDLERKLSNHRITACMDVVGGDMFGIALRVLAIGGRYCTAGAIAGPLVEMDLRHLIYKDLEMFGATRMPVSVFRSLVLKIASGAVKPPIAKIFPLEQIREAQKFFQAKSHFGKIVIKIE